MKGKYLKKLKAALKNMKNNKSPGSDGLPWEFYKIFWNNIKHHLNNSLNYAFDKSEMSITQREGIITLLPKESKNIRHIKNWRPITLLNCDYKLATKCISNRLCKVLPKIINSDQTGFIKGRYIGENIIRLCHIMDLVDEEDIESLVMNVDFQKAFDSLEYDFIDKCLKHFNFGLSLQRWVRTFYTNANSVVLNNGWATNKFKLTRGARQGDPISPYIFLICAEILATLFRNDPDIKGIPFGNNIYTISQYADDTIITLKYTDKCFRRAVALFKEFEIASGLAVNYEKTEILPIGPIKYNFIRLAPEIKMKWTNGPIKCLGVVITHDVNQMIDINFMKSQTKIENLIQLWKKYNLTLQGKVVIINSFMISQLVYQFSVLPDPSLVMLEHIEKMLFKFIWNDKPDRIKRDIMKQHKLLGGINVPDIKTKNKSLKLAWINRILHSENMWVDLIYRKLPIKNSYIWECNLKNVDCQVITRKITSRFIVNLIQCWCDYRYKEPTSLEEILSEAIWFNSFIKVNNKPVFYNNLYQHGVKYVSNMFDEYGIPYNFEQFQRKYNVTMNFVTYMGLLSAIPKVWKVKLMINNISNIQHKQPTLLVKITLLKEKISKFTYKVMMEQVNSENITAVIKWSEYFSHEIINKEIWLTGFHTMYRITKNSKLLQFQFNMLHHVVITREKVYTSGIVDSDVCRFCLEDIETLEHVFFECEIVKLFWAKIQEWVY